MKRVSANADAWVIHHNHALLFHQHEGVWHEKMRMPFDAFLGSATALSSFTLPETRVYLNLHAAKTTPYIQPPYVWTSVEYDPLRFVEIPEQPVHQHQRQALASMGQQITVVSTENPSNFERATPMLRVNAIESKHLGKWTTEQKKGAGKRIATLRLLLNLWHKPCATYQQLRLVAATCTLTTAMLLQFHSSQQIMALENQTLRHNQHAVKNIKTSGSPLLLEPWSTQINKFGKGDRANLKALSIQWHGDGHVSTTAQLNRERKRAPKGCTLESPTLAVCSTAALAP
ncbi:hypothetical protein [Limnobacter sp.]|uniref:hypothetical protein n=1 Tax=Limnobacter sp. TaxID=2003368 RepID=UPI002FE0A6D7